MSEAKAQPFVKWAGGKRSLVPEILKHIPDSFNHYWEPFLGGGAVFFALNGLIDTAHLSDYNRELITTYKAIRRSHRKVIELLRVHEAKHNRAYYQRVRSRHDKQKDAEAAARFIYLNKTCYNGLYRVNRQGEFNVPVGSHSNPTICDETNIEAVAKILKKADLSVKSFEKITPHKNDLVYCDPPYDGTFANYTDNGFGKEDQEALRDSCDHWRNAGVNVIVSNSDTELIRALYKDFTIYEVAASRHINCNGNGRGKTQELLIVA